jgi:hypothetical protein
VPVEFLTDEQAAAYGAFNEVPTRPELERFFFLDDGDRELIALRRTDVHRLGMAVQICTVRYIGRFLGDDPLAVPWEVIDYLAKQLDIEDASVVKSYPERRMTPYQHAQEIRERFGYRDYFDKALARSFRTFVYGRAWTHAEGPVALFNHAVTWLRRNRVLLPGVSVLARQVAEARQVADQRLYKAVAKAAVKADPSLAPALRQLLVVPEGKRVSELERLRTPPTASTGTAMKRAMERVEEISGFRLGRVNLSRVPVNRLNTLARYGQLSKAQTIERAPEPRQTALLTAVVRQLEAQAIDDALDLFVLLMATRLINPEKRAPGAPGDAAAAGEGGADSGEGVEDPGGGAGPGRGPGGRPGRGGAVGGCRGGRASRAGLLRGGDGGGSGPRGRRQCGDGASRAPGAALQHGPAVPVAARGVERAGLCGGWEEDPARGAQAAGALKAPGGGASAAARRDRHGDRAADVAQGGALEREAAAGVGGP